MKLGRYVSDAVVDLLSELGCRYLPLNPGSSFRGLHDSVVNHGGNTMPEVILCTHEEIAVSIAHSYAKATGTVGFAAVHDLVGLMHASMAIYDAWCDRTPLVILGGGGPADPKRRRPIDWFHSANTQSALVRPFVKWDDDPTSPQAILDAVTRAHFMAGSAPTGPTYVTVDAAIQEDENPGVATAVHGRRHQPPFVAPDVEVQSVATQLVDASFPVIVAGGIGLAPRAGSVLVDLMETLGAASRDERSLNAIPTTHPLCFNGDDSVLQDADVILAIDAHDVRWLLDRAGGNPIIIDLSTRSLATRSWTNADHVTGPNVTSLVSDPIEGLGALVEAVTELVADSTATKKRDVRLDTLATRRRILDEKRHEYRSAHWDDQPIAPVRLVSELYESVADLPWLLTLRNTRSWPEGIWQFDRPGRYLGHSGGGGMGYGPGALVGGGLAARDRSEFAVGIIGDGDLLFAPGAIWTAVHHQVPMLVVVNNNRTYLNDEEHQAQVARARGRPVGNAHVGTTIEDPNVDFAALARAQGAWAEEPIEDPEDLKKVFGWAIQCVHDGGVAVVDVITGK